MTQKQDYTLGVISSAADCIVRKFEAQIIYCILFVYASAVLLNMAGFYDTKALATVETWSGILIHYVVAYYYFFSLNRTFDALRAVSQRFIIIDFLQQKLGPAFTEEDEEVIGSGKKALNKAREELEDSIYTMHQKPNKSPKEKRLLKDLLLKYSFLVTSETSRWKNYKAVYLVAGVVFLLLSFAQQKPLAEFDWWIIVFLFIYSFIIYLQAGHIAKFAQTRDRLLNAG